MNTVDVKNVLILGAGTMGQQIGFVTALHGFNVVLYDVNQEILDSSVAAIRRLGAWFERNRLCTQEQAEAAYERLQTTTDKELAAKDVDLISESLPEDPQLKIAVFSEFHQLCPQHAIFTTNTSTLIPSMMAEHIGRPQLFLAFHFHDVKTSNIVDVMPHPGTSPIAVDKVMEFAKNIGQEVILVKKENSGYVFNAMLSAVFASALGLASQGVADVEEIDKAWMGIMHTKIGPFGIMDQVGLQTVWSISDFWAKKINDANFRRNADFIKKYLDEGRLGIKTKKGFYDYPNPAYTRFQ